MNGEGKERDMERMVEDLEKELRKFGMPYASPEPDERYWATFRMRALDRIEQSEGRKRALSPAGILGQAKDWIAGHLLGTGLAGAALASLIALSIVTHPFGSTNADHSINVDRAVNVDRAANVASHNSQSEMKAPDATKPITQSPDLAAVQPSGTAMEHGKHHPATAQKDKWMASKLATKRIEKLPQMASADASDQEALIHAEDAVAQPTLMESDGPVSLNDLNSSQLESIYEGLKSEK